ncbi:diaminopropionate ammonia-lyase [Herbaspirillum sp. GCM10030257]|uniref:diaminopropionate ammonia-lyase n=1 Tax=Herbaspirillum sp. GCM10030257 TaxID=3273393 RepID=UPI00361F60CE
MLVLNQNVTRETYPPELARILNVEAAEESRAWLRQWDQLRQGETPLWSLRSAAKRLGVAEVAVKDESVRSTLGSFKALGAPIALIRLVRRLWPAENLRAADLFRGQHHALLQDLTVISATDGNHGRALAAAARSLGCRCVIVLHAHVSAEREQAIAAYGARIIRISGNYDESVNKAARLAAKNKWFVVSDTSYDGYEDIPRDVMQGYGTIVAEVIEQTTGGRADPAFTHVFLQGGVGGLAAGLASYFWEYHGEHCPRFVVVEPEQADCLMQSAIRNAASKATGTVDSVMAGLACGEASPLAWKILQPRIDAFQTIQDSDAVNAMQWLASGCDGDVPIVAGESGAAGLAGLVALLKDKKSAEMIGLNSDARILLINTEGATAPSVYADLTGVSAAQVLKRQADYLSYPVA